MKLQILYLLPALFITFYPQGRGTQAQICDDWKAQSTAYVVTGSTPADPAFYQWEEKGNNIQGVHLCVLNADVIPVYIQKGNNYINFTSRFGPSTALLYMVQVEVNINGNGYTEIYSGSAKQDVVWYSSSDSFPETGEYDLKVRVVFFDGTIRYRQFKVKVIPPSQKLYKDNAGNTLRKWEGNDPSALNAIVFSEGFDAYNTNPQEMYYSAAAELIACLRENGYDVFLLDNYFGTQDIRNNAAVFASAVNFISSVYGNELIVAGGVSMGGIISRYALARAEQEGAPLPVHTFIAIDSPHQGAVVSEPLQNFKKDNEEDDEFAKHALSNTAARQLLVYNAYDPGGAIHHAFYDELNSLNGDGYPHLTRNIGVSFSTPDPNPNAGGWYKITYHTGPLNGTVKTFDLTEAEMQSGSWLPRDLTTMSPIIKQASYWWLQLLVPGITPLYYPTIAFERFTDPAYIPYYSAMDLRNGNSMFDVCIEPASTTWHDVLPGDILDEIVNEVILTNIYFQNKHVVGNWNLRGLKVAAGNYVTALLPPGDVIVHPGGKLSVNASGTVMLRPGFRALSGSSFHATADPGLTYACGPEKQPEQDPSIPTIEKVITKSEFSAAPKAIIYPNPARDHIMIRLDGMAGEALTVDIYNQLSEPVLSAFFPAGSDPRMNISHLPNGTYLMRISNGKSSANCKLVKI